MLFHEFWLTEVGVLAVAGCPAGLSITRWWDDRALAARFRKGLLSLPTIPDALLVVQHQSSGQEHPAFLEMDLGTEVVRASGSRRGDLAHKIEGYLAYDQATFSRDFAIKAGSIVLMIAD